MTTATYSNTAKVPVLLLAFNRPAATKRVLDAIAIYQPPRLYVGIDGPRLNNLNDAENCKQVEEIINQWETTNSGISVFKLFQKENLGCGPGVSTAISWFFDKEEMGIILEDDCLPNKSFFPFCQELLHKYLDVEQVMHISGSCFLNDSIKTETSYYFSIYAYIWGWASWKRAWQKYEYNMPRFAELLKLPEFLQYYDDEVFVKTKTGKLDTWDSQWIYSILMNNGLSISPAVNMVSNLGFEENPGSHIIKKPKWYNPNMQELSEIKHPDQIMQNIKADSYVFRKVYKRGILYRFKKMIRNA
jgi:hypothetical protein